MHSVGRVGAVLAFALALAGCTGDDAGAPESTDVEVTTTTAAPRPSDGVLSIGVLLPITGPGAASLGQPMGEAIEAAIGEINDAGGVLGQPVHWTQADEAIEGSFADLLEQGVDAVIGPASSLVALSELDIAVQAGSGVVVCSPSATALALDDYPDNGYFFRTVPSDSLQMAAIAQEARRTGVSNISIAYLDDPYGRGLADALAGRIGAADVLTLTGEPVGFSGDQEDLSEAAAATLEGNPGVVVVLADEDDGGRFLSALGEAVDHDNVPAIIVNDSIRNARQAISGLDPDVRARLTAVAPQAVDDELPGFFAANAVDCVNLIALSVARAQSDRPVDFRRNVNVVSFGGRPCSGYASCAELLETVDQIDYQGESGPVDLRGLTGDVSRANFDVFGFTADGTETDPETREASL